MIKDAILQLLWKNADTYISGAEMAQRLSVSRTAVWKAVEQLRSEGYLIRSVTHKGYRLSSDSDVLSEEGIRQALRSRDIALKVFPTVSSTNTVLKSLAADGAPEGTVLVAGEQTEGRGRMGRRFYSPADTGLYMSLLLRPGIAASEATKLTACAAVAVAEAIEELSGVPAWIKWVNDVLARGKKVCGILTEASLDCECGLVSYVIVGIGINIRPPEGGFPEELRDAAGAVFEEKRPPQLRCRMAAAVLDRLLDYSQRPGDRDIYEAYRRRSLTLGQDVNILTPGRDPVPAKVLDIGRDYALTVRLDDGSAKRVSTGEVSLRVPFLRDLPHMARGEKADEGDRDGEQQTVRPVEHAPVAGDQVAEVLDADHPLHKGLGQVSDLTYGGGDKAGDHQHLQRQGGEAVQGVDHPGGEKGGQRPAEAALRRFFRAD